MPTEPQPRERKPIYRRKLFWLGIVIAIYLLAGFLLVPPIAKSRLVSSLQQSLGRPVAVQSVAFNPLTLGATLRGVKATEKDGSPLLSFDRLYVRLSPTSLIHWAWSFGQIELEGLRGEVIRFSPSDSNVGRLIQSLPSSPQKAKPDKPARIVVGHLSLKDARLSFTDHVPAEIFKTEIGPVNAEIDRFSTLPDKTGQQHIVIDMEKGAVLELTSQSGVEPIHSTGHVKAKGPFAPLIARYLGDSLPFKVPNGSIDTELDYRLQARPDGDLGLAVEHLAFAIDNLALHEGNAQSPFLTLPHLKLAGGHLAWPERQAGADSLTIEGLSAEARQQADGSIAPMPFPKEEAQQAATAAAQPQKAEQPWTMSLGKVEIKNARAKFEDQRVQNGGKIEIASLDLTAESLSNKPDAPFPFALNAGLAPGGTIKLEGKASALPGVGLDAKLTIGDLPVSLAQTYLHDFARLTIEDGKLNGDGEVKYGAEDGLKVVGKGEIRSVKLSDEAEKTPVVTWDHLGIDRYAYNQARNNLQISQVTLSAPFVRFQKAKDQSTNFSHILVPAAPKPPEPPPPPGAKKMTIGVGKIVVEEGSADYGDASLPLPFQTHITKLQGNIKALSSTAMSASGVGLQGQVEQYGQVNIYGKVNPFQIAKGMKVNVEFRNVDFPGLSPYSAKFAGRRIAKGTLDVLSQYSIEDGKMEGKNRVVIHDLQLGERIDVPGALDLPLDLAISLLKDDEGKIDLDIPVTGDVNDPHFDFGAVISKEIADILGEIVTAPFRLLAGLFGGDSDTLGHIDFPPGRADLAPPEQDKIRHIAEAMDKRPKLKLVVAGVMDPEADRRKLQHDAIDAEMARELGDHGTIGRQRRLLEGLFEQRLGKDKLAEVKKPFEANPDDPGYVAELRKQVATTEKIDDSALANLAKSRGEAVTAALKQIPGLDPQRIEQQGPRTVKSDDIYRIPMKLGIAGN